MRHRADYSESVNAYRAYQFHASTCPTCLLGLEICPDGKRLFDLFRAAEKNRRDKK